MVVYWHVRPFIHEVHVPFILCPVVSTGYKTVIESNWSSAGSQWGSATSSESCPACCSKQFLLLQEFFLLYLAGLLLHGTGPSLFILLTNYAPL